jgi:hypothetical protein
MLKIADVIEEHPEHFHMRDFCTWTKGDSDFRDHVYDECNGSQDYESYALTLVDFLGAPCGMTACLGGWACNLWPAEVDTEMSAAGNAQRILGLTGEQADALFFAWPDDAESDAHKAAERIRRWIAEGGIPQSERTGE